MSSSENILQSVKTVIQDVVAPDVRELKVKVDALSKRVDSVESNLGKRIDSVESNLGKRIDSVESNMRDMERRLLEQSRSQFEALLAAIKQSKAETELLIYKGDAALAERVTALEIKVSQYMESKAA